MVMAGNSPKLMMNTRVDTDAHRTLKLNIKTPAPRHVLFKQTAKVCFEEVGGKTLTATRETRMTAGLG